MEEKLKIDLPPEDCKWEKNNCKLWPKLTYEDIVDYLILSKAYDGKCMKAFRAMYGYNYVQNGWMGDIYSVKVNDIEFLKATVSPSQPGVGRTDYSTWVAISKECIVITAYCTCPAGTGRSCSHVSALLYAITLAWSSGVGGTTCTDVTQAWGRGAAKSLVHERLVDMSFDRPNSKTLDSCDKKRRKLNNDQTPCTTQYLDHKELEDSVQQSVLKPLWDCKGTMLYKILHTQKQNPIEQIDIVHGSHEINAANPLTLPLSCATCDSFYNKYICLSSNSIKVLENRTQNQDSSLWLEARKLRITASKANSVPKTMRADPNKFINNQLFPRFKGCAATKHGQKNEPKAREWFQEETGKTVLKSGIVISQEEPYFAASPDGIIDNDTILEIKCPTRPLKELISSGKYDVFIKDGQPFLNPKGTNGYYCQVQMTMFCTRTRTCKFVLWTPEHQCILDVKYSEEYLRETLPRLRKFYFEHLLERLTDEKHHDRLKISKDYKILC